MNKNKSKCMHDCICDTCEIAIIKELNETKYKLNQKLLDLIAERKINDSISEDLRLAKQFIDSLLIDFNLTNYNWLYDQNEISTILCEYKKINSCIEQLQEKISILDAVGDTEENMRSFIEAVRILINEYTKNIKEV